jgi:hypothetical protein
VPLLDLRRLSDKALASAVDAIIRKAVAEPFDYGTHPLLRVRLIRIGDTEHKVLVVMPHVVGDGWSVNIHVRELLHFHVAARDGANGSLGPVRRKIAGDSRRQAGDCDFLEASALRFRRAEPRT